MVCFPALCGDAIVLINLRHDVKIICARITSLQGRFIFLSRFLEYNKTVQITLDIRHEDWLKLYQVKCFLISFYSLFHLQILHRLNPVLSMPPLEVFTLPHVFRTSPHRLARSPSYFGWQSMWSPSIYARLCSDMWTLLGLVRARNP
jgi:hypothetical protein